jgi:formylglycine-generating enzyme required for sulfatase activity
LLNRNSERAFRFSHYTIREFLIAYGLVNKRFDEKGPLRATDQLVRFVELATNRVICQYSLDMTDFDFSRYVEKYWLLQDRLENGSVGPEMILLPAGRFRMGEIQKVGSNDGPAREMSSFAIGRYPVTFTEYDIFCEAVGRKKPKGYGGGRGRKPVVDVNWRDGKDYCEWLSRETGQQYRLPTEAEWEYACRAGSESAYCFGDDEKLLGEYAWYEKNSDGKMHPVGEKKANVWGIHDMHGSVGEWCQDWYENESQYRTEQKQGVMKDPKEPLHPGIICVIRGGTKSWNAQACRSDSRSYCALFTRYSNIGFRLARVQE